MIKVGDVIGFQWMEVRGVVYYFIAFWKVFLIKDYLILNFNGVKVGKFSFVVQNLYVEVSFSCFQ